MTLISSIRSHALPLALVGALGGVVAGCGDDGTSGDAADKIQEVQKKGEEIQESANKLQEDAEQIAADVKAGKITQKEATAKLEQQTKDLTDSLTEQAKQAGDQAIEVIGDEGKLSESDKKTLQEAKDAAEAGTK